MSTVNPGVRFSLVKFSGYVSFSPVGGPVVSVRVSVFGICMFMLLSFKAPWNGRSGILRGDVKFSSKIASRDMYVFLHLGHRKANQMNLLESLQRFL